MRLKRLVAWCCVVAICGNTTGLYAQTIFKTTLAGHLGLKSTAVSCNCCHVKGESKKMRNDFGKLFEKEFAGQDLSNRLKGKTGDEKKEIEAEAKKLFLEALGKIEKMAHPDGGTYGEALKDGKVELKP